MDNVAIKTFLSGQLPDFIRSDYPTFLAFLESYYSWMELQGNAIESARALIRGNDIDLAEDVYFEELKRELMPFFPEDILGDKRKFLKVVSEFYKAKGTPAAIRFFFRVFYNEEIEVYFPKEDILKASDGKWILPQALRISSRDINGNIIYDPNIFLLEKRKITGKNSKATALVEKVVESIDRQLGISYIELYISNIERLFETGELITSTFIDENDNQITVEGKLLGSLSNVKIDPNHRGLYYRGYSAGVYDGDPVSIIGGFNASANNPVGAIINVGDVTLGSLSDIIVINGGFGFRPATELNSSIIDFTGGFGDTMGSEAVAKINLVDSVERREISITDLTIELLNNYYVNTNSIYSNTITSVSTYQSLNVYPIAFVTLTDGGGGYIEKPSVDVYSFFNESVADELIIGSVSNPMLVYAVAGTNQIYANTTPPLTTFFEVGDYARLYSSTVEEIKIVTGVTSNTLSFSTTFRNNIPSLKVYKLYRQDLRKLGSLGRINIVSPGTGYAVNDKLIFTGGSGIGANANVTSIYVGNSGIETVEFQANSGYIIGGEGYTPLSLPTITVQSANGANAVLSVSEILGDGERLDFSTTKIGAISSLRVSSYGFDYSSTPLISLRNASLSLANVTEGGYFESNTQVYQGTSNTNYVFSANVSSFIPGTSNTGTIVVYNYQGIFDQSLKIKSGDDLLSANVVANTFYGDGKARANATFRNGLIEYPGIYLNTDGQVSSDKKLQDADKYQNYSYEISINTDLNQFKESYLNLAHPTGTKLFVNRIIESDLLVSENITNSILKTVELSNTVNVRASSNSIVSTNTSDNLISSVNIGDIIIVYSVDRRLANTVNVATGANTVIGTNTSFMNDLIDGSTVFISTGNTVNVSSVESNVLFISDTIFYVTQNNATINVISDIAGTVLFVNANTILVDTIFTANGSYLSASLLKAS